MTVLPGGWIAPLKVELAFGADLSADPTSWTWTDVSDWLLSQSIQITRGRSDESSQTQPATTGFVLDNLDGRFTPRNAASPHYPHVKRRTPCRISIEWNETSHPRFAGYVYEWAVSFPDGGATGESRVTVTASGPLRRVNRLGVAESALVRTIAAKERVHAYWPLTEALGRQPRIGDRPLIATGIEFGVNAPPNLEDVAHGSGSLEFEVLLDDPLSVWSLEAMVRLPDGAPSSLETLFSLQVSPFAEWLVQLEPTEVTVQPTLTNASTESTSAGVLYDDWFFVQLQVSDDGGSVSWSARFESLDASEIVTLSDSFSTGGTETELVKIHPSTINETIDIGHIVVTDSSTDDMVFDNSGFPAWATDGWWAEPAASRIQRLGEEIGVGVTIVGSPPDSAAMGHQPASSVLALWRECEAADGGVLVEDRDLPGITFRIREDMRSQATSLGAPVMELDASNDELSVPFAPSLDDQQTVNDMVVTTPSDARGRAVDQDSIDETERYDASANLNLTVDAEAVAAAGWRVLLGTVDDMRIPRVSLNLTVMSHIIDDWLALEIGDRLTIDGLPSQHPDIADLLMQGYRETFAQTGWDVQMNCSPAAPWRIGRVSDAPDPYVGTRFDTDGCELDGAVDDSTTSIDVVTVAGNRWTTDGDDMPFDVIVEGEVMAVTGVTGTDDTQTLTVTRGAGGTTAVSHLSGTRIRLAEPALVGW